ncbi:hypothetical protein OAG36_00715 [bacterium]|nr:hypothetical protein [bacterium]
MKTAILQVADTGPLESLVVMLEHAGYECYIPDANTRRMLKTKGLESVCDIDVLVRSGSYEEPKPIPCATIQMMQTTDLYVDVKAHKNGPKLWRSIPHLEDKTLFYCINGANPFDTPTSGAKKGEDRTNLPCPVLSPNLWYRTEGVWSDRAYSMWPKFMRFDDYLPENPRSEAYSDPICLVHNLRGWGYHIMKEGMQSLNVQLHGWGSPAGPLHHSKLPDVLSKTIAMVHLKSSDAPGYALYEALAAGCPIIASQRLIERCLMQELFIDGETCLVFDTVDDLDKILLNHTQLEIDRSIRQTAEHLERLRDPVENARIGTNGRNKLKELMWNVERDGEGFKQFMRRMF